jgi:2,4-dienoyl-CoA reductase-like NADH-dependent reductase (Old Yellow Enzyme family)/NADPH-dependent 2,4-dienoyl-CoA reductase/sulfur reductase-like enzyme
MSRKYKNLLSPIKVGNVVFKNRLTTPPSNPYFAQGAELYPTEASVVHYVSKARNGAALITCIRLPNVPVRIEKNYGYEKHSAAIGGRPDMPLFNSLESHFAQAAEAIHFYNSKISAWIGIDVPRQYDVIGGVTRMGPPGDDGEPVVSEELPEEMMNQIADEYALQAAFLHDHGFDAVQLHMSYRLDILGRFLSPMTNQRTDKYGGSPENRTRFPIMVVDRIKQKCGPDFLVEASMSGPTYAEDGLTLEETIEHAKCFAGHVDLLQIRSGHHDMQHPTGFNPERTPFLYVAEAIKKSGANIAVVTLGGYDDLDQCEEIIASGKADFISMGRAWVSNPDFGLKAYEGRKEDVVPCLKCNGCHMYSWFSPTISVCAVNPTWGMEHLMDKMVKPPTDKKKVAVVGGGPAGMKAALVAAERGHQVTLYEKSDALGGLFKTAEYPSFKWPHNDFKNYLIRQVWKSNIKVCLNTEATPEMLKGQEYDAVLAAVGAEPIVPDIPGVDGANVVFAQDVYGHEAALAEKVVVIGGGETGVETGMYLAENGHEVIVLEQGEALAPKSVPIHFYSMFKEAWEKLEKFHSVLQARCTGIGAGKVTYVDASGAEQSIEAGSVVIAVGTKPKHELAMGFYDAGDRFFMVGDCNIAGNIQKAIRSAFSIASML